MGLFKKKDGTVRGLFRISKKKDGTKRTTGGKILRILGIAGLASSVISVAAVGGLAIAGVGSAGSAAAGLLKGSGSKAKALSDKLSETGITDQLKDMASNLSSKAGAFEEASHAYLGDGSTDSKTLPDEKSSGMMWGLGALAFILMLKK
jgi:hypothetical protein